MPVTAKTESQADTKALELIQETRFPTDGPFYRKLVAALKSMAGTSRRGKITPALKNVQESTALRFAPGVQFEYAFSTPSEGRSTVGITTNCYGKSISFAQLLDTTLRSAIPVPYRPNQEPEIHILGGNRRKGMLTVELSISTDLSDEELTAALKEAGFYEGLEFYLG